ncbi:hypothetical protein TW84_02035 [Vibrio neptunius]|nr:hypothetical protein TW84_02035 [Vibrio neptunius]
MLNIRKDTLIRLFLLIVLFPNFLNAKVLKFGNDNIEFISTRGDKFNLYPEVNRFLIDKYPDSISMSPDSKHIIIQKTLISSYVDESGKESEEIKGYCDIVRVDSGCVIGTYSGEVCGANWSTDSKLLTSYGEINIPNHSEQLPPKLMVSDIDYQDIDFTIESYMACYPITDENKSFYMEISNKILKKNNKISDYNVINERLNNLKNNYKIKLEFHSQSLCYKNELVLSTVVLENDNLVSFCLDKQDVIYRYGNIDNVELTFSESSRRKFYYVNESGGSVNDKSIFFHIGKYKYLYKNVTSNIILSAEKKNSNGKWDRVFFKREDLKKRGRYESFPDLKFFTEVQRTEYWNGDW